MQFSNLKLNIICIKAKNIYEELFTLPKERRGFVFNDGLMVTPVYFYRSIGLSNEKEYFESLLRLDEKLLALRDLYIKLDKGLDKAIPSELIHQMNRAWSDVENLNQPPAKLIVDHISKQKITESIHPMKDEIISEKLTFVLDLFMQQQKNMNIVKNFYIKILYWINQYVLKAFSAYCFGEVNPKALFYGDIQRDEIYFLLFLSFLGFDVMYFNSFSGEKFNGIPHIDVYTQLIEHPHKIPLKPFPIAPGIRREETVAFRASQEIHEVLYREDTGLYRPWQFEHYDVVPKPLRTTYEELFILWKEEARFRSGFKVNNGRIYIPNVFAKISGTNKDMGLYWKNMNLLRSNKDNTIFIEKIPFSRPRGYGVDGSLLKQDGTFDLQRVRQAKEYRLSYLRTAVQDLILNKINELVQSTDLFNFEMTVDFRFKILYTLLHLEKSYLSILQKFDYPTQIPKVVIFDGDENTFSQEDIILLAFFHLVGFDIVIFTPTGYNNIENGINAYYFDVHRLEDLRFGLRMDEEQEEKMSPLKKGFFWFFQ